MRQAGPALLLVATALAGCGTEDSLPAPDSGTAVTARNEVPAVPPAAPSVPADDTGIDPSGGSVRLSYACSDGSTLQVRYGHYDATVHLADGTTITLPRARSASAEGVDAYLGGDLALQREGRSVRLRRSAGSVNCQAMPARK